MFVCISMLEYVTHTHTHIRCRAGYAQDYHIYVHTNVLYTHRHTQTHAHIHTYLAREDCSSVWSHTLTNTQKPTHTDTHTHPAGQHTKKTHTNKRIRCRGGYAPDYPIGPVAPERLRLREGTNEELILRRLCERKQHFNLVLNKVDQVKGERRDFLLQFAEELKCVCIYIYMYVYIYIYIYIHTYTCICVCVCIRHTHVHT
jgi:hypothetical protein